MQKKAPDPNQPSDAVEANIKLNEEMNSVYELHTEKINSPTDANLKINEEFYGEDGGQSNFDPTFLYSSTPPIQITKED